MVRFLERRGWIGLAALAGVVLVFGVVDVRRGLDADPGIPFGLTGKTLQQLRAESADAYEVADFAVRGSGINIAVLALLLLAILLTAYRGGQRWSWWVMWLLPLWGAAVTALLLLADRAPGTPPPPPMVSGPIVVAIGAAILLGSARRFLTPVAVDAQLEAS